MKKKFKSFVEGKKLGDRGTKSDVEDQESVPKLEENKHPQKTKYLIR